MKGSPWTYRTKLEARFLQFSLVGGFSPFEKYARQNGNLPQVGVKIKNVSNHLVSFSDNWYHPRCFSKKTIRNDLEKQFNERRRVKTPLQTLLLKMLMLRHSQRLLYKLYDSYIYHLYIYTVYSYVYSKPHTYHSYMYVCHHPSPQKKLHKCSCKKIDGDRGAALVLRAVLLAFLPSKMGSTTKWSDQRSPLGQRPAIFLRGKYP